MAKARNLTQKIIAQHLVTGKMNPGSEIGLRIDQTLTQDATGTMAYLQFEAIGIPRVRTELSVSYVDHNTLQTGFRNPDDHRYLRTIAQKYGIVFSPAGTGICHQLHLENFAKPGKTLIGSDSHTPTAGGVGSLAIGAGGLSVALAMAGDDGGQLLVDLDLHRVDAGLHRGHRLHGFQAELRQRVDRLANLGLHQAAHLHDTGGDTVEFTVELRGKVFVGHWAYNLTVMNQIGFQRLSIKRNQL